MTVIPAHDILDLLRSLVDKSLVVYEEQNGVGRYRLLETVRQYGREKLTGGGEAEVVQERAASWFLALAEEAESHLNGPEQGVWLDRLEREHDNLRTSLSWFEEQVEGAEAGLRISGAMSRFWVVRGHYSEGCQWLGKALERTRGQGDAADREASAARAKALLGAGILTFWQGDTSAARALYEESLTIYRQLGDQIGIARSLGRLGSVLLNQGNYAEARALREESLTIYRQLGDRAGIARSLSMLGDEASRQGDYTGARALQEESLSIWRQIGDQGGITSSQLSLADVLLNQGEYSAARALIEKSLTVWQQLGEQGGIAESLEYLGNIAYRQEDYAGARTQYEESLTIWRRLRNQWGIADLLSSLGRVANKQCDFALAWVFYKESLTLYRQLGNREGIIHSLRVMAELAPRQDQLSRAAQLLGAAAALHEILGSPLTPADQEEIAQQNASVREALGEDAFSQAWDAGRAMTVNEAIEFALETTMP